MEGRRNLPLLIGALWIAEVTGSFETAMILGEVYRNAGEWKFRAVGQGFKGGLGPLATHFGVNIG